MPEILTAQRIFTGDEWLHQHAVIFDGPLISAVQPLAELSGEAITDLGAGQLVPGLVDLQVNGGGGVLLNSSPQPEAVERLCNAHVGRGTTALLPTVMSDTEATMRAAIEAVANCKHPAIAGVHLEGPHFAPSRRGAHAADRLRPMDRSALAALCELGQQLRTMLTVAPEVVTVAQIAELTEAGILVCAGHSEADFDTVQTAIDAGLAGFTHLFNAMSPLLARRPGMTGAALHFDQTWASVIADGHHVHPAVIKMACRAKPAGKLTLVSDAMASAASNLTGFNLYGERIELHQGRLETAAGTLAGSNITLLDAVAYCHREVGIEFGECLRMASLYPSQILAGSDLRGRIASGYRADLLMLDDDLQATASWVAGKPE